QPVPSADCAGDLATRNPSGRTAAASTTTPANPITIAAPVKAGSLGALGQSRQGGGLARSAATVATKPLAITVSADLITSQVQPTRQSRRRFPTNTMSAPTMTAADPRSAIA